MISSFSGFVPSLPPTRPQATSTVDSPPRFGAHSKLNGLNGIEQEEVLGILKALNGNYGCGITGRKVYITILRLFGEAEQAAMAENSRLDAEHAHRKSEYDSAYAKKNLREKIMCLGYHPPRKPSHVKRKPVVFGDVYLQFAPGVSIEKRKAGFATVEGGSFAASPEMTAVRKALKALVDNDLISYENSEYLHCPPEMLVGEHLVPHPSGEGLQREIELHGLNRKVASALVAGGEPEFRFMLARHDHGGDQR